MNNQTKKTHSFIRKEMKNKRLCLYEQQVEYANFSKICQVNVLESKFWNEAENIALYQSFRGEVDTSFLIQRAYEEGKNVYFPRCVSEEIQNKAEHLLEFIPISTDCFASSFEAGNYGILEPKKELEAYEMPDNTLVFLPCLAYNKNGHRLGYGGGYYDRFLASHSVKSCILAFSFQYSDKIIPQVWDIAVDYIATEKELLCLDI